jgi:hypothetical protein
MIRMPWNQEIDNVGAACASKWKLGGTGEVA